jgi:hypothetical protein
MVHIYGLNLRPLEQSRVCKPLGQASIGIVLECLNSFLVLKSEQTCKFFLKKYGT